MSNVSGVAAESVTSFPPEVAAPARDEQLARVEISLLGTILALTLLGNGTMAGVLRRISLRRKLTRMNRMMAHLTVADIFVAVCHILPQVRLHPPCVTPRDALNRCSETTRPRSVYRPLSAFPFKYRKAMTSLKLQ